MKIEKKHLFLLLLEFIKLDFQDDADNWLVADFLSSIEFMPSFKENISSPTSDPAYWYDWKDLFEAECKSNSKIVSIEDGLTLEQGMVAGYYFMNKHYWEKNNHMLLKDAYDDLMKEVNFYGDRLTESALWKEWLVAVEEAKKCNMVFDDSR